MSHMPEIYPKNQRRKYSKNMDYYVMCIAAHADSI